MSLQAVVFDFDGLILDTETPEVRAWQRIFAEHEATFPDEYWMHAIGRGADQIEEGPIEILDRLAPRSFDPNHVAEQYDKYRMEDIDAQGCLPGVEALILECLEAGLPIGVASSSRHDWVDGHLERLGLIEHFGSIVCADDVARAKPYPDLYEMACAKLCAEPSQALAIEDSPNGIKAAKTAGLRCIAVPNQCTKNLSLDEADRIHASLEEITLAKLISWMDGLIN